MTETILMWVIGIMYFGGMTLYFILYEAEAELAKRGLTERELSPGQGVFFAICWPVIMAAFMIWVAVTILYRIARKII